MTRTKKEYNAYMNSYMKERWERRRTEAIIYLGGRCVVCGNTENLEFDHIDPSTKIDTIPRASSWSELRFWEEVNKCQLLCIPHHREKTRIDGSYSEDNLVYICCDREFIGRRSYAGHIGWHKNF